MDETETRFCRVGRSVIESIIVAITASGKFEKPELDMSLSFWKQGKKIGLGGRSCK